MPALPALRYPLINGYYPQWSSLDFSFAGLPPLENLGVAAIDYRTKTNPANVFGAGTNIKLGETVGQVEASGSLTVYKNQSALLLQSLAKLFPGQGYLQWRFGIVVNCDFDGSGIVIVDQLIGFRFTEDEDSHKQGNDALVEKWTMSGFYVIKNGIPPIGSIPVPAL